MDGQFGCLVILYISVCESPALGPDLPIDRLWLPGEAALLIFGSAGQRIRWLSSRIVSLATNDYLCSSCWSSFELLLWTSVIWCIIHLIASFERQSWFNCEMKFPLVYVCVRAICSAFPIDIIPFDSLKTNLMAALVWSVLANLQQYANITADWSQMLQSACLGCCWIFKTAAVRFFRELQNSNVAPPVIILIADFLGALFGCNFSTQFLKCFITVDLLLRRPS